MKSRTAFTFLVLLLLLVLLAHVSACGRGAGAGVIGGAKARGHHGHSPGGGRPHDITQFIVPTSFGA